MLADQYRDLQSLLNTDPKFRQYFFRRMAEIRQISSNLRDDGPYLQARAEEVVAEYFAPDKVEEVRATRDTPFTKAAAIAPTRNRSDVIDSQIRASLETKDPAFIDSSTGNMLGNLAYGAADSASFGILTGLYKKLGGKEPSQAGAGSQMMRAGGAFAGFLVPGGVPAKFAKLGIGARSVAAIERLGLKGSKTLVGRGGNTFLQSVGSVLGNRTAPAVIFKPYKKRIAKVADELYAASGLKGAEKEIGVKLRKMIGDEATAIAQGREGQVLFGWEAKARGIKGLKGGEIASGKFYHQETKKLLEKSLKDSEKQINEIFRDHLEKQLGDKEMQNVMGFLRKELEQGTMTSLEAHATTRWGKFAARAIRSSLETAIEFGAFTTTHALVHGVSHGEWKDPGFREQLVKTAEHGFMAGAAIGGVVKLIPNIFWAGKEEAAGDIIASHGLKNLRKKALRGGVDLRQETAKGISGIIRKFSEGIGLSPKTVKSVEGLRTKDAFLGKIPTYRKTLKQLKKVAEGKEELSATEAIEMRNMGKLNAEIMDAAGLADEAASLLKVSETGSVQEIASLLRADWKAAIGATQKQMYWEFVQHAVGMGPRILASSFVNDPHLMSALVTGKGGEYLEEQGLTWSDAATSLAFSVLMAQHSTFHDPVLQRKPLGMPKTVHEFNLFRAGMAGMPVLPRPEPGKSPFPTIRLEVAGRNLKNLSEGLWQSERIQRELGPLRDKVEAILENDGLEVEGTVAPEFAREVPHWLRRLNLPDKKLSPGQMKGLERVLRSEFPMDELTFEQFDDYHFGPELHEKSGKFFSDKANQEDLSLVLHENKQPIKFTYEEDQVSARDRELLERAASVSRMLYSGDVKERKLKDPQMVRDAVSALERLESGIKVPLGEKATLEGLPGLREFGRLAPVRQVWDMMTGMHHFPVDQETQPELYEIQEFIKTVNEVWGPKAGVPRGDDDLTVLLGQMAQARWASEGIQIIRETSPGHKVIIDAYKGLSDTAKAFLLAGEGEFSRYMSTLVSKGDISHLAHMLHVQAQRAGLIDVDGTTEVDLRRLARSSPQPVFREIFESFYDKGVIRESEKLREATAEEVQAAELEVFGPAELMMDLELSSSAHRELTGLMVVEGKKTPALYQLAEILHHPAKAVRRGAFDFLVKEDLIKPTMDIHEGKITIQDGVSSSLLLKGLETFRASLQDPAYFEELQDRYGSGTNVHEAVEFSRDPTKATTPRQFVSQMGFDSAGGRKVIEELRKQVFALKGEGKGVRGDIGPDATLDLLTEALYRSDQIRDGEWQERARLWLDEGGERPEIGTRVLGGRFMGDAPDRQTLLRIAHSLSGSRSGMRARPIISLDPFGNARVTARQESTLIESGLSDVMIRAEAAGAEVTVMSRADFWRTSEETGEPYKDKIRTIEELKDLNLLSNLGLESYNVALFPGNSKTSIILRFDGAGHSQMVEFAESLFPTDTELGKERWKRIKATDFGKKLLDPSVSMEDASLYLSDMWMASVVDGDTFTKLVHPKTRDSTRTAAANRMNNVYGQQFYSMDYDMHSEQGKILHESEFGQRKLAENPEWDGELATVHFDNAGEVKNLLTAFGLNRAILDGGMVLREDALRAMADMIGANHSNSMKAQFLVTDYERGRFHLDKPEIFGGEQYEALLDALAEKLDKPVDGIVIKDSTKIDSGAEYDTWKMGESQDPYAMSQSFSHQTLVDGVTERSYQKDLLNIKNLGIKEFNDHILPYNEGYAGELYLAPENHARLMELRERDLDYLYQPGSELEQLFNGELTPFNVGELAASKQASQLIAEAGSAQQGDVYSQQLIEIGTNPATVFNPLGFAETINARYVDRKIIKNLQREGFGSYIDDSLDPTQRRGEIVVPKEIGQRPLTETTRVRIGSSVDITFGKTVSGKLADFAPARDKNGEILRDKGGQIVSGMIRIDTHAAMEIFRTAFMNNAVANPENPRARLTMKDGGKVYEYKDYWEYLDHIIDHELSHIEVEKKPGEAEKDYEQRVEDYAATAKAKGESLYKKHNRTVDPRSKEFWTEVLAHSGAGEELFKANRERWAQYLSDYFTYGQGVEYTDRRKMMTSSKKLYELLAKLEIDFASTANPSSATIGNVLDLVRELTAGEMGNAQGKAWYQQNFRGVMTVGHSNPRVGNVDRKVFTFKRTHKDPYTRYTTMHHEDVTAMSRDIDGDSMYFHHGMKEDLVDTFDEISRIQVSSRAFNEELGDPTKPFANMFDYQVTQDNYKGSMIGTTANLNRDITWMAVHGLSAKERQYGGVFDEVGGDQKQLIAALAGAPIKRIRANGEVEWKPILLPTGEVDAKGTPLRLDSILDSQFKNQKAYTDSKKSRLKERWDDPSFPWLHDIWWELFPINASYNEMRKLKEDGVWDSMIEERKGILEEVRSKFGQIHRVVGVEEFGGRSKQPLAGRLQEWENLRDISVAVESDYATRGGEGEEPVASRKDLPFDMVRPPVLSLSETGRPILKNATASERMLAEIGTYFSRMFSPRESDIPTTEQLLQEGSDVVRGIIDRAREDGLDPRKQVARYREWLLSTARPIEEGTELDDFAGGQGLLLQKRAQMEWLNQFRSSFDDLAAAGKDPYGIKGTTGAEAANKLWIRVRERMAILDDLSGAIRSFSHNGYAKFRLKLTYDLLTKGKFDSDDALGLDLSAYEVKAFTREFTNKEGKKETKTDYGVLNLDEVGIRGIMDTILEHHLSVKSLEPTAHGKSGMNLNDQAIWEMVGKGKRPVEAANILAHVILRMVNGGLPPKITKPGINSPYFGKTEVDFDHIYGVVDRRVRADGKFESHLVPRRYLPHVIFESPELQGGILRILAQRFQQTGGGLRGAENPIHFQHSDGTYQILSRDLLRKVILESPLGANSPMMAMVDSPQGAVYRLDDFRPGMAKRLKRAMANGSLAAQHRASDLNILQIQVNDKIRKEQEEQGLIPNSHKRPDRMVKLERNLLESLFCK